MREPVYPSEGELAHFPPGTGWRVKGSARAVVAGPLTVVPIDPPERP